MGDSAEFEKLTVLEARLATALDRITAGLSARGPATVASGGDDDTRKALAEAEEARLEAESRAAEMTERVDALEARLEETQDSLAEAQQELSDARSGEGPGSDAAALTALEARLSEVEAKRGAAERELSARNAELDELRRALETAQAELDVARAETPDAEPVDPKDLSYQVTVLTRRVERARAERDEAREACDTARDLVEELREGGADDPDARILALRRDLRITRMRAEDLAAQLSLAQSGTVMDADMLNLGLRTELEAMRDLRKVEAAELGRILEELEAGLEPADEVGHA